MGCIREVERDQNTTTLIGALDVRTDEPLWRDTGLALAQYATVRVMMDRA